jgi:hypothetical protein
MEGLRKKWLVVVLFLGVLVLSAMGVKIYLNNQAQQEEEFASTLKITELKDAPVGVPVGGFYDYDTTEHKAMFVIKAVDPTNHSIRLQFIFPTKLQRNEIASRVTCSKSKTKIYYGSGDQLFDAERSVYEETRIVPGETVMQAICADKYCRSISKYCELWLKE